MAVNITKAFSFTILSSAGPLGYWCLVGVGQHSRVVEKWRWEGGAKTGQYSTETGRANGGTVRTAT